MPSIAVFILIALPWLNPFSPGPSSAVAPLLFSWACAAALLGMIGSVPGRPGAARWVEVTAGAWLAAALLSVGLGLLQYFGGSAELAPWVNRTGAGEAFANLRQRNQFASLTNIGLVALLWWMAPGHARAGSRDEASDAARRHGWLLAAILLGVGNAASSSRTGLLQLGLVLALALVWGLWRNARARRVLLAAALAYLVASVLLPWLAEFDPSSAGAWARLRAGDSGCTSRLTLWGNVLQLIAQKPWFGWGWGELDYAHFITLYPGVRFCEILDNAHNLPLQLAVELGIPLTVLIFSVGAGLVWRAKPWVETHPTRQLAWGVLAVILLHSLLEYPLWYGPFQMAAALCVYLVWRHPGAPPLPFLGRPLLCGSLSVLILAGVGYAAWDFHRVSQIYRDSSLRSEAYREHTLEKIQASRLFQNQVRFAELTTTALTRDNAAHLRGLALEMLHFSPEPRVIEKLIESAVMLGRDDEALFYLVRYQAAFPERHARWARENLR